jgi:hypothetical protein
MANGFSISDLYAVIHWTLRNDEKIREYLGLDDTSTLEEFALKIQKRAKPKGLVEANLPLIAFYANPGSRGENPLEYITTFDFDIYTPDDVELALNIADRIKEIFEGQYLALPKGSNFKAEMTTCAEAPSDLSDTYKFFIQILVTLGIEE